MLPSRQPSRASIIAMVAVKDFTEVPVEKQMLLDGVGVATSQLEGKIMGGGVAGGTAASLDAAATALRRPLPRIASL